MEDFILYLSGFKKEVVNNCKVDKFHATIIGTLLLLVGIYAILAWTFFFQTVFDTWVAWAAGIFMGSFIVTFDRALISSMAAKGGVTIGGIIFRFILAILLGIFLSQPMILKFYEPDIKREAEILIESKVAEKKEAEEALSSKSREEIVAEIDKLETILKNKESEVTKNEENFSNEMDRKGGTMIYGYGDVAKQKQKIWQNKLTEYNGLKEELNPQIEDLKKKLNSQDSVVISNVEKFKIENTDIGFLIRAEALKSLLKKDETGTLAFRYYLLSIILTLIELSALITKLFFKTRSYQNEIDFITEVEIKNTENNKEIYLARVNESSVAEIKLIQSFFRKSEKPNEENLEILLNDWKGNKNSTYRDVWESFVKKFVIHNLNANHFTFEGEYTVQSDEGEKDNNSNQKINFGKLFQNPFMMLPTLIIISYFGFLLFKNLGFDEKVLQVINQFLYLLVPITTLVASNNPIKKYARKIIVKKN